MSTPQDQLGTLQAQQQEDFSEASATANIANQNLDATVADFNPPGQNTRPQFNEQVPQDHINTIMGIAPLLMGLGAIGGKFGNAHGIAMLESTNAMLTGLVKGNDDQFSDAQKQYEKKYQEFKDQNKTWNDVYKAYLTAYKDRVDAQKVAVQAANASVNIIARENDRSRAQVTQQQLAAATIMQKSATVAAIPTKLQIDQQKADAATAQAAAATARAGTGAAAEHDKENPGPDSSRNPKNKPTKSTATPKQISDASDQIDALMSEIKKHPEAVGIRGKIMGGVEVAGNITGLSNKTDVVDIRAQMAALQLQVPKLLTGTSKSAKDERAQLHEMLGYNGAGDTQQNLLSRLAKAKAILQKQSASNIEIAGQGPTTATDGSDQYVMMNGNWVKRKQQ